MGGGVWFGSEQGGGEGARGCPTRGLMWQPRMVQPLVVCQRAQRLPSREVCHTLRTTSLSPHPNSHPTPHPPPACSVLPPVPPQEMVIRVDKIFGGGRGRGERRKMKVLPLGGGTGGGGGASAPWWSSVFAGAECAVDSSIPTGAWRSSQTEQVTVASVSPAQQQRPRRSGGTCKQPAPVAVSLHMKHPMPPPHPPSPLPACRSARRGR